MPELPEVETSRRGIAPYVVGERVTGIVVRDRRLRWPVSEEIDRCLPGQTIELIGRRAKYLLFNTAAGTVILHLGMSGSVSIVEAGTPPAAHDHVDIGLGSGRLLRYRDPRRFGSLHWCTDPDAHWLLLNLGPEPLDAGFSGRHLWEQSRGRRIGVKPFIMDSSIVVGVGNIYASESLHIAGIHPRRAAGRVSVARYEALGLAIQEVLRRAIDAGGTTLRDFYGFNGEAGYFQQQLDAYGRDGLPCRRCGGTIRCAVIGQRASYYCGNCQR